MQMCIYPLLEGQLQEPDLGEAPVIPWSCISSDRRPTTGVLGIPFHGPGSCAA